MKTEEQIYERALKVLPGGISRNIVFRKPHPYYVAEAHGAYVTDIYGVKRADFANNIASLIHGHSHPKIVEAVIEQLQSGTAFSVGTEAEVLHAELLCSRIPSFDKIRFMNSGTEAVMSMIKAARAFTGKTKIAKAEGGYHGSFDAAEVSVGSSPENWGDIDRPNSVGYVKGTPQGVLDDVVIYPFNDTERTISILNRYKGEIACVIIDPVPHRIGMIQASQEFVEALYKWTRENNALLCFDEVICFRVEYEGAQSYYKVKPDLTSMGKMIGGGFPVGAFAGRKDIMDILDPGGKDFRFSLSGTFSANPMSMVAGRIAMEMFDREAVDKLNNTTQQAKKQVLEAGKLAGIPLSITGTGSLFKVHFRESPPLNYRDSYEDANLKNIMNEFLNKMYDEGIIMVNSCSCFLSTVTGQTEIDLLSEAMLNSFKHIKPLLKV